MTALFLLLPAMALACAGPYYDPNKHPPAPNPVMLESVFDASVTALHDTLMGKITCVLLSFAGFYWAVKSKKPYWKAILISLMFPISAVATFIVVIFFAARLQLFNFEVPMYFIVLFPFFWLWRKKIIWWKAVVALMLLIFVSVKTETVTLC
jgi:hypothetical protein